MDVFISQIPKLGGWQFISEYWKNVKSIESNEILVYIFP